MEEIAMLVDAAYAPKKRGPSAEAASVIGTTIGKFVDRLPQWGKFTFYGLTVIGCVYYIARYGFFQFLLRTIFSP